MLEVIGGTYRERCADPEWDEIFGSGLRAAAALSSPAFPVHYTTYASSDIEEDLASYAATYDISLSIERLQASATFHYYHPLAQPIIAPMPHVLPIGPPLRLRGEAILRFGMLEGTAIVAGDRVVYDPQSAYTPELFDKNGSTARFLAVVANQHETELITGRRGWEGAAALLDASRAAVVTVKRGARGVMVISPTGRYEIPAYQADKIFPIGSGDVFAAVFAAEWAVRQRPAEEAANTASLAVAHYVRNPKRLPLLPAVESGGPETPSHTSHALTLVPADVAREVYLAGPFFTMAQRWLVSEARDGLLAQGVKVFSPFHDIGIGDADDVVPKDIEALRRCDAVFGIADGHDAGTLFEIGYARSLNKPVVVFVQHESDEALKMLRGTECEVIADFTTGVYHASWAALRR